MVIVTTKQFNKMIDRKKSFIQRFLLKSYEKDIQATAIKRFVNVAAINESAIDIDPSERAKARWKNAIMNQILLIRMERENKKLAANISATETRRQKLSYQELATYSADAAKMWDSFLKNKSNERVDDRLICEAVRGGIPKARRGDIWQFLIKQNVLRIPDINGNMDWKNEPYKAILKKTTSHQHAILIDLGRTFPTHAHFIPRLGSGQLGLFNVLKAYSLLDDEVGYCQGLSFVAGMLLMHLNEEDAFKSFCHVMFSLDIRRQYKPDMNAVQQQMYQLTRLLHDYHPVLYEHFNKHDVTPTLYAAPWFLTLYASQYPVGFVARVMDLVLLEGLEIIFKVAIVLIGKHINEILECDSFETIVDYMKLTLPERVCTETDEICTKALDMDIKQKLNLYEVEYQLLKEEMIDIKQSKEKIEKQEREHKELQDEVKYLKTELDKANSLILDLKASLELANQERDDYKKQVKQISCERDMLNLTLTNNMREKSNSTVSSSSEKFEKKDWELLSTPDIPGEHFTSSDTQISSHAIDSYEIPKIDDVISIKSTSSIESEEVILSSKNDRNDIF